MTQYLLTRHARLTPGNTQKSREWVQNVTEKVGQVSGLPIRLYQQVFSPDVGGVSWQVFSPNLTTLETLFDKIQQDDSVIKLLDAGVQFLADQQTGMPGHLHDTLSTIVQGKVEEHGAQQSRGGPEYQTIVESIITPGNYVNAGQMGMDIATRVQKSVSAPTLFALDQTGAYGGARWITSFSDVKAMQQAQERLAEDRDFQSFIDDEASSVFTEQPYATRQYIYRRMLT